MKKLLFVLTFGVFQLCCTSTRTGIIITKKIEPPRYITRVAGAYMTSSIYRIDDDQDSVLIVKYKKDSGKEEFIKVAGFKFC